MIQFTLTSAGATALSSATAGVNPVVIDSIILYNNTTTIKTITDFVGCVVSDDSGIGDYVVIDFEDITQTGYTITQIRLKSGAIEIAISENISVVKQTNKKLKIRITAQFENASKCSFSNTGINLPYATQFRDGVIRLAKSEGESQKDKTVYSAQDVESIINSSIIGTNLYVPWDLESDLPVEGSASIKSLNIVDDYDNVTYTAVIQLNGKTGDVPNISVGGYITGTAVSSSPTISNGAITSSSKVVNESYISSLYANEISTINNTKLVTSYAVSQYISSIENNYVHITGAESISGVKTFTDGISSASYSGNGIYSTYASNTWNISGTETKIPTVGSVADAIDASIATVTTAYQNADNNLQEQIDGINAGQNLSDIVNTKTLLASHSLDGLKARGDIIPNTDPQATYPVGDKIQVLHDTTASDGTYDDSTEEKISAGIATVYELVKGTIDTTTYPKDVVSGASGGTGYYWHYIGEYGVDAYSKSESDNKYVAKASLDQSILTTSSTTNAPSTKAVFDYVDGAITTAGGNYVKLSSATTQTIASPLIVKQASASTNTLSIPDGQHITTNNTLIITADSTNDVSTEYDVTQVSFVVKLDSSPAMSLTKTNNIADVSGDLVASYRDSSITSGSLSDGRLVTVDFLTHFTSDMSAYAKLASNNTFTGTTNTFSGVSATLYSGSGVQSTYSSGNPAVPVWNSSGNESKLPTVEVVDHALDDLKSDILNTLSTSNEVGSIGLFIYTETGAEKTFGDTVDGQYLKPVGMSLPMSGQISYKAVAANPALSGTWKLLSVAFKRTATEPCLVLAQKISSN